MAFQSGILGPNIPLAHNIFDQKNIDCVSIHVLSPLKV